MNWGKGIGIGLGLFIAFILTLVITLMRHHVDLEHKNYYELELQFNQQQQANDNFSNLNEELKIEQKSEQLVFHFPVLFDAESIHIHFQRPNDEKLDLSLTLPSDSIGTLPLSIFVKGNYKMVFTALVKNEPVRFEQDLIIE